MALNFGSDFLQSTPPLETTLPFQETLENQATLTKHRDTYSFIDPYRFKNKLSGKVVLITQAHRGIGRSSAVAFAQAGASVCCVGPSTESLEPLLREIKEKFNTPTLALTANLLVPNAPAEVVRLVEQHRGPVDILINVPPATYSRPFETEPGIMKDWWPTMESSVRVPVALIHAVLPSMIERRSGTIISTTLISGVISIPWLSAHGSASAALIKFHHHLHIETAKKGIVSFAVHPGLIPSHLHDPSISSMAQPEYLGQDPELREVTMEIASRMEWCSAGLASGTYLTLCAEPRAKILSGLYVNAERDLEETIQKMEQDWADEVKKDRLYLLKVDEY
ncbi:short-chain dehydrogenase/reductase SDR [Diplocarpon rosae]|nr:short-chain dehydrogenase/reductase SDR [Diplocarpon rosae]